MYAQNTGSIFQRERNDKKTAQRIAAAANADLFEIVPAVLYTDTDLNWTNKKSRSSVEMANPASRPEIANRVSDMAQYDTILLGFPIWWYTAPTIIKTFLESYDFSGKTIALFATSGGSGMGKTASDLKPCVGESAKILSASVLNRATDASIQSFLKQITE